VGFVERTGEAARTQGFVPASEIFAEGQRLGFVPSQIEAAIARLHEKNLIEGNLRGVMFGEADQYRITPSGVYTLKRLSRLFTYIDAMIVDTPIVDKSVRRLITDVRSVGDRLARAENFRRYLDQAWRGLADREPPMDWDAMSRDLAADIERIALRTAG
jgi:DNA-binding PadR family transcriptional regulator